MSAATHPPIRLISGTSPDAPDFYDPWASAPPPSFPGGVLPRTIEDTIIAISLRDGIDAGALMMSHLTAVSGAARKDARFFPLGHRDWSVPPVIWTMLVNESGTMKSAMVLIAFGPLMKKHTELWRDYARSSRQSDGDSALERPHSYVVQDATVEALQDILADSTRGTLLVRDELAGMLGFGRYAAAAAASERAFYLESYEGTPFTVSRKTKGKSVFIEVTAAAVAHGGAGWCCDRSRSWTTSPPPRSSQTLRALIR